MRKPTLSLLAVLSSLLFTNAAFAAPPVKITSLRAGGSLIWGGNAQSTRTPIECVAFEGLDFAVPVTTGGAASGKPQFSPLVCTHTLDSASPLLLRALAENQVVTATFVFTQTTPAGAQQTYYTITLTNAHIVALRNSSPSTLHTATATEPATETFEIAYTDITVTHNVGGTAYSYSSIVR